jgi:hypothetical protein
VVVRKKTLPPRTPLVYIHCPVTVPRSLRSVRGLAVWRGTPLARVRLRGSNTRRPQDLRFLPAQHEVSAHASCERSQTAAPSRLPTRSSGRVCVPKQACALARRVPLFLRPLISSLCEAWAVRPLASFLLARPLRHVGRLCRGPLEQHSACRPFAYHSASDIQIEVSAAITTFSVRLYEQPSFESELAGRSSEWL